MKLLHLIVCFSMPICLLADWVLVPRNAIVGASIGDSIGKGMRQFAEGVQQGRAANEAFTQELNQSRDFFWSQYPDGPNREQAEEAFSRKLWEKDLGMMLLRIPTGPNVPINRGAAGLITNTIGDVAGGAGILQDEFNELVIAIRESYGATNHYGIMADPVFPVNLHNKLQEPRIKKLYDYYRLLRDYFEFESAGYGEDFFETPGEQFFFSYASSDLEEDDIVSAFNNVKNLVGEDNLRASMAEVWAMPNSGPLAVSFDALKEAGYPYGYQNYRMLVLHFIDRSNLSDETYLMLDLLKNRYDFTLDGQRRALSEFIALNRQYGKDRVLEAAGKVRDAPKDQFGKAEVGGRHMVVRKAFQFYLSGKAGLPQAPALPEKSVKVEVAEGLPQVGAHQRLYPWRYLPNDIYYHDGRPSFHKLTYISELGKSLITPHLVEGKYMVIPMGRNTTAPNVIVVYDLKTGYQLYEFKPYDPDAKFKVDTNDLGLPIRLSNGYLWLQDHFGLTKADYMTGAFSKVRYPWKDDKSFAYRQNEVYPLADGRILVKFSRRLKSAEHPVKFSLYDENLEKTYFELTPPSLSDLGYEVKNYGERFQVSGDTIAITTDGDYPAIIFYSLITGEPLDTVYLAHQNQYPTRTIAFDDETLYYQGIVYDRNSGQPRFVIDYPEAYFNNSIPAPSVNIALKDGNLIVDTNKRFTIDSKTGNVLNAVSHSYTANYHLKDRRKGMVAFTDDYKVIVTKSAMQQSGFRPMDKIYIIPLNGEPLEYQRAIQMAKLNMQPKWSHALLRQTRTLANSNANIISDTRELTEMGGGVEYLQNRIALHEGKREEAIKHLEPIGWVAWLGYNDRGWTDFSAAMYPPELRGLAVAQSVESKVDARNIATANDQVEITQAPRSHHGTTETKEKGQPAEEEEMTAAEVIEKVNQGVKVIDGVSDWFKRKKN